MKNQISKDIHTKEQLRDLYYSEMRLPVCELEKLFTQAEAQRLYSILSPLKQRTKRDCLNQIKSWFDDEYRTKAIIRKMR